ncbi:MAG: hypothetical protein V4682_01325 [Patescibacteria group bacterium]
MTDSSTNALLEGCKGPYMQGLEPAQALYTSKRIRLNKTFLKHIRDYLPGPVRHLEKNIVTLDDYVWPHGISFRMHHREIMVLMPRVHETKDPVMGSYAGRDIVLLYRGRPLSDRELERILRKVAVAIEDAYEDLYGPIA